MARVCGAEPGGLLDAVSKAGLLDAVSKAGLLDAVSKAGLLDDAWCAAVAGRVSAAAHVLRARARRLDAGAEAPAERRGPRRSGLVGRGASFALGRTRHASRLHAASRDGYGSAAGAQAREGARPRVRGYYRTTLDGARVLRKRSCSGRAPSVERIVEAGGWSVSVSAENAYSLRTRPPTAQHDARDDHDDRPKPTGARRQKKVKNSIR